MQKIDILILLFSPAGRDPEAMIPLAWYLEKIFNYKVKFGSMFDCRYLIDKYKPQTLLLNNIDGSEFNVQAANYAYNHGVKVVTLVSEGLFRKDEIEGFIWGNNKDKKLNWHKMFVWSEYFLKMTQDYLPEFKDSFDVSGSTGLDRYIIYKFMTKKEFLNKYQKKHFNKIITYSGFAFGSSFDEQYIKEYSMPKKTIILSRKDMYRMKSILQQLITNNPDILFVLKKHPSEKNPHMEIDQDWDYTNMLVLSDEETLGNILNVSDILLTYQSTMAIEAYCLLKPVITSPPSDGIIYKSKDLHIGNAIAESYEEIQKMVDEYYKYGKIKSFTSKKTIREKLIEQNVGAIDGLNSWRTAVEINFFIKNVDTIDNQMRFSITGLILHVLFKFNFLLKVLPRFRKSEILYKYNTFKDFYLLKKQYDPQIKRFYDLYVKYKSL